MRDEYRGRVFGSLGATIEPAQPRRRARSAARSREVVGTVTMLNVASALTILAGVVVIRAFATSGSAGRAVASRATRPG